MKTTIVIGGGPAGLIAASKLADAGVKTTVLEAKAGFGGRAASERQDGFDLNQGPHALYVGGAAMRALRAVGVDPPGWNPASVTGSLLVRDGKLRRTLGPRTLAALGGLLRRVMKRPIGLERISVAEWLDAELRSASGREAAAALVRVLTFVADHERLSADVAAGQVRIGLNPGVRYIEGGWQWLVDTLAVQAERRGAELKTRAAVRALERSGDGWTVVTDDAELEADAVIVAAGQPAAVAKLVGDRVSPPGPPAEISSLDLGLRRLPRRRHTFALGLDQPTYFSRHSHPKTPDGALLTVASYAAQPLEALEALADLMQPGWRDEVIVHRHLPTMVPVSAIATPETGGLPGRPGVVVQDSPGLFLAGDWIGPEGWLVDAALASGARAACALLAAPRAVPA